MFGALFETAVVAEIRKLAAAASVRAGLYHWRSHGGAEVDLVLEHDGTLFPVEIKLTTRPSRSDAGGSSIGCMQDRYRERSPGRECPDPFFPPVHDGIYRVTHNCRSGGFGRVRPSRSARAGPRSSRVPSGVLRPPDRLRRRSDRSREIARRRSGSLSPARATSIGWTRRSTRSPPKARNRRF